MEVVMEVIVIKEDPGDGGPLSSKKTLVMEVHCHQRRPWRWRSIVIKEDPGDGGHCHQRRPW